jgi:hypothetical protein
MPFYTKKPATIEARQFLAPIDANNIADWCDGKIRMMPSGNPSIDINTLEGEMTALLGDYIIKGVEGEFYPVKPRIFLATYDPVANSLPE